MTAPLTVLMPVFNGAPFLRAAIDSVLAQTHRDFEFIVVDDGSSDESPQILQSYRDDRMRMERFDQNRGLSAALNHGLQLASAPLIARQDQDDVSRVDRLATQLEMFGRQPGLVIAGSQARTIDGRGQVIGEVNRPLDPLSIHWFGVVDNPFIHTSVMFQRRAALDAGGYDGSLDPYAQDFALWWKMIRRGPAINDADRLVDYRVNPSSITGQTDAPREAEYRRRFEAVSTDVVSRHALELFGERGLSDADARVLGGFAAGIDAERLDQFLDVFARVLSLYEAMHPEAAALSDFRLTVARQYDAIAYRVRPASRRSAARVYAHALRHRPALAGVVSWPRIAASVAFGREGRMRLGSLWSGIQSRRG
jgi:hypothetical protein